MSSYQPFIFINMKLKDLEVLIKRGVYINCAKNEIDKAYDALGYITSISERSDNNLDIEIKCQFMYGHTFSPLEFSFFNYIVPFTTSSIEVKDNVLFVTFKNTLLLEKHYSNISLEEWNDLTSKEPNFYLKQETFDFLDDEAKWNKIFDR